MHPLGQTFVRSLEGNALMSSNPLNSGPQAPGQPSAYQPQSNLRATMQRRVPVPIWAIMLSCLIGVCLVCGLLSTAVNGAGNNTANANTSGGGSSHSGPQPTATHAPTPTATHVPQWTTIQTFQGNGNKKTSTFTVPDDWRIVWSCDPRSFDNIQYNVIIDVYNADGSDLDLGAVNTLCKSGNTTDNTEEHQGGSVYLDIQSEAAWKVQIQVLK